MAARIVYYDDSRPGITRSSVRDGRQLVTSSDVNDYIRRASGTDFTVKNFRPFAASGSAFETLSGPEADLSLKALLEPIVARLGNTAAIAHKSYVHPPLIALVKKGQGAFRRGVKLLRSDRYLSRVERDLIALLESIQPAIEKSRKKAA